LRPFLLSKIMRHRFAPSAHPCNPRPYSGITGPPPLHLGVTPYQYPRRLPKGVRSRFWGFHRQNVKYMISLILMSVPPPPPTPNNPHPTPHPRISTNPVKSIGTSTLQDKGIQSVPPSAHLLLLNRFRVRFYTPVLFPL